ATLYAIRRILHYVFICVAIVLAAQCVGLNFGTLAVAFGFLGVGIGLGLQNITANFVSGLILLLERPVRIGDLINIDGKISEVIGINMRVTVVRTFDNVTVLVPNTKLVENEVINWTVDDPRTRIHCPVGVAYGSDTTKVKEVLLAVAKNHKDVLEKPEPEVRFLEFGDSSLNFDLLIWTSKPENQKVLRSDINFMIDAAFREHDIKIPFPQRDIHLQMTPAVEKLSESKEAR
ncbi:MAG: mechanosensitive ion channel, partial [Candidatus Omnitrophica bacterium]|nr:mechanosensitive ion channel [Candidatus Omnitrophota bacterium]